MTKLISSNNYSVLALSLMLRNNEQINNDILDANENNPEAGFNLGEISESLAEELNVATNDEDTTLTKMMITHFQQRTGWEVVTYKTEECFERCRGESYAPVDFFHDVADTDVLLRLLDDNKVVKLRASNGDDSSTYRQDDWEIKLLRKLQEKGIYAEISITGEIILVGVLNSCVSEIVETVAGESSDGSTMDAESEDLVEMLSQYSAKLNMIDGFITFSHI